MASNKSKISVTVNMNYVSLLEKLAKETNKPKSQIVEDALAEYFVKQLEQEADILSSMKFDDLPSEDDWLEIQSQI